MVSARVFCAVLFDLCTTLLVGFGLVRPWWAASFSTLVGHDVLTVAMISTAAMAQMANVYHVASRFVQVSTSFEEELT
jgi:hypothetical protein